MSNKNPSSGSPVTKNLIHEAVVHRSWKVGVDEFNKGRFWHAHEFWEVGWKNLEQPEKTYIQALIQSCAAFHLLISKFRIRAATSLTKAALEKLALTEKNMNLSAQKPRIEIPGLQAVLNEILEITFRNSQNLQQAGQLPQNELNSKSFAPAIFKLKGFFHT